MLAANCVSPCGRGASWEKNTIPPLTVCVDGAGVEEACGGGVSIIPRPRPLVKMLRKSLLLD